MWTIYYSPEINSIPVPLPGVTGCNPLPDQTAVSSSNAWTDSFANIQCYDSLKVQAVLNWIDGKDHSGTFSRPVPKIFGMNFQVVSVGQKLIQKSVGMTGGYLDNIGTPTQPLLGEIEFADNAIGSMVAQLKKHGLYQSTLVIISAKHMRGSPPALVGMPTCSAMPRCRSTWRRSVSILRRRSPGARYRRGVVSHATNLVEHPHELRRAGTLSSKSAGGFSQHGLARAACQGYIAGQAAATHVRPGG